MDKKGPFLVRELKMIPSGKQVWGKYLILDKVERRTRDGKSVINLRLGDLSGEIDAVAWDNCAIAGVLEVGKVAGVLGDTSTYNGRLQITARRLKSLEEDPLPYQKSAAGLEHLKLQFQDLIASLNDPYLKKLITRIFSDSFLEEFFRAPAARRIHHQYAGGLLEHTISVASLCRQTCALYPELNQDLTVAGALVHDMGKVEELNFKAAAEYTAAGRMLGHIYIGSEMLAGHINQLRSEGETFPEQLELMLKHMILSHHGLLEFGSPVKPLYPEAFLLHMMDNLDAKMHVFWNKIKDDEDNPDDFTPYDNMFGQHYYKLRYRYEGEDENATFLERNGEQAD